MGMKSSMTIPSGARGWMRSGRKANLVGLASTVLVASLVGACAVEQEPAPGDESASGSSSSGQPAATAAEQTCQALAGYLEECGGGTSCDEALLADCAQVTGLLNDAYLNALTQCLGTEKKSPSSCLQGAVAEVQATASHQAFAERFCSGCMFGVTGCTELILGGEEQGNDMAAAARKLVFSPGDSVVDEISDKCTSGMTCAAELPECAKQVLVARGIPESSIECLLGSLTDPNPIDPGQCLPGTGGSGAGGSTGGSGGSGAGGSTGCAQVDKEPNDSELTATPLDGIDDCNLPSHTISGTVEDYYDVDSFWVKVEDELLCFEDPYLSVDNPNMEMCVWLQCETGEATVTGCGTGGELLLSLEGRIGCCTGSQALSPKYHCKGGDDNTVFAYVQAFSHTQAQCSQYNITYHF
jgi:hypothetical protein